MGKSECSLDGTGLLRELRRRVFGVNVRKHRFVRTHSGVVANRGVRGLLLMCAEHRLIRTFPHTVGSSRMVGRRPLLFLFPQVLLLLLLLPLVFEYFNPG